MNQKIRDKKESENYIGTLQVFLLWHPNSPQWPHVLSFEDTSPAYFAQKRKRISDLDTK
jgi:hypothetical protein